MPSNPLKPLHDALTREVLPLIKSLHKGKIAAINKKELCKKCFELYGVSDKQLMRHISTYYVGTDEIIDTGDCYKSPVVAQSEEASE